MLSNHIMDVTGLHKNEQERSDSKDKGKSIVLQISKMVKFISF